MLPSGHTFRKYAQVYITSAIKEFIYCRHTYIHCDIHICVYLERYKLAVLVIVYSFLQQHHHYKMSSGSKCKSIWLSSAVAALRVGCLKAPAWMPWPPAHAVDMRRRRVPQWNHHCYQLSATLKPTDWSWPNEPTGRSWIPSNLTCSRHHFFLSSTLRRNW